MTATRKLRCWEILLILLSTVPVSISEENLALTGIAKQSENQDPRWKADKAIDNCIIQMISGKLPHCCAHTAVNNTQSWWRVDLVYIRTIQFVTIYYRSTTAYRFGGYSLYVSNSTNHIEGILCYQDNSSLLEDVDLNPTHLCPYVAQYVTVYNHREEPKRHDWYSDDAVLELCEVQVFGCQIGSYGNGSCNNLCPESCYGGNCDAITGSCFYCFPGMFGVFCEQYCSANCNNTCEKDSGHCLGCKPGKKGDLCNAKCSPNCVICDQTSDQCFVCVNGKYGYDCEQDCSNNCKNRSCMKENGYCLDCVNGKYGDMCDQDCSDNCKDQSCMKDDGSCLECITGKYGNDCTTDCSDDCRGKTCMMSNGHCIDCINGKYGDVCDKDCSDSCKDRSCMKENGYCLECVSGKHGDDCTTECSDNCEDKTCVRSNGNCIECVKGKHGDVCDHACSDTCKDITCLKENGFCFDCIPGKTGELCTANCSSNCVTCNQTSEQCFDCVNGNFGDMCDQECSENCNDKLCMKNSGHCLVCTHGKYGPFCTFACPGKCKDNICQQINGLCTECEDGLFGGNCSTPCGNCERCTKDTGYCLSVCAAGYEGNTCDMKTMPSEPSSNAGAIVGVVIGLLLVAATILISVFLVRRRRQKSKKQDSFDERSRQNGARRSHHSNSYEPDDNSPELVLEQGSVYEVVDYVAKEESLPGHGNAYANANDEVKIQNTAETPTTHSSLYVNANDVVENSSGNVCNVAISDLKALVKIKMLNEAKVFQNEYESLPSRAIHEHNIGMLNENRPKNRFKSTFPYDHSRVILDQLDNDPHSDYINANHIDSVTSPAEYIATQGPTDKTVDDLWRMLWQLKSGKVVMLTKLIEGTKKKCAKYWPEEGEPMSTKHFDIVLDRERVYAFYVIRDIILTEKKTRSVRQIHQFHYISWPDHGTPDPNELVVFHRHVKHCNTALKGKMVVHCSAGIGRTGTFIALDALLEHGKNSGMVDVMGYIRTMRKDRVNMVQTIDQYIAIHYLLIEALDMPDTLIPRSKYHTTLQSLCDDVPINQTRLWREYKLIQDIKPTYTRNDYKTATMPANWKKNKDPNVLAVDKFRAYLPSSSFGRTDYINALEVPSYTSRTGYIVTQTPLEDTVVDLLTMIMDQECDTIVIIENEPVEWLPEEGNGTSIGSFILRHEGGSSNLTNTDLIEVAISNQDHRYDARIRVFQMSGWDRDVSVPPDAPGLLQLLELLESRRRSNYSKKTVVMCRDGYSQSGLFCCICNARDQMKIDEEIDIFQIVKQIRFRRPEFITNYDQYQCCYNVIKEYLDTADVYMN